MGTMQSPININSQAVRSAAHRCVNTYKPSTEHLANTGHTIRIDYDPGSGVEFDGKFFRFVQLHFHTPAEHQIDGVIFPLEVHLVHVLEGTEDVYLVEALLFKRERKTNSFKISFPMFPSSQPRELTAATS